MTYTAIPIQQIPWVTVTSDTQMVANQGYIIDGLVALNMTLPPTFLVGDIIKIRGGDGNGWVVKQNNVPSQSIQVQNLTSTSGAAGSVASSANWNSLDLTGYIANTKMTALPIGGTPIVT